MGINVQVAGLIDDFLLDGGVIVERRVESTIDSRGEAIVPASSEIAVSVCAWHTLSERELNRLPEADRRKEGGRLYTKIRLLGAGDLLGSTIYAADVIRHPDGKRYQVSSVADYSRQGGVWIATCLLEEATT